MLFFLHGWVEDVRCLQFIIHNLLKTNFFTMHNSKNIIAKQTKNTGQYLNSFSREGCLIPRTIVNAEARET